MKKNTDESSLEVRFYHLTSQTLEAALPALLSKALSAQNRILVRFGDLAACEAFDTHLWTYTPDSFLPHGMDKDGNEAHQPVFLTTAAENPNGARMLVLCGIDTVPENIKDFTLCCDFIDGRSLESVAAGRTRWKAYKDLGCTLAYWQQDDQGRWTEKSTNRISP